MGGPGFGTGRLWCDQSIINLCKWECIFSPKLLAQQVLSLFYAQCSKICKKTEICRSLMQSEPSTHFSSLHAVHYICILWYKTFGFENTPLWKYNFQLTPEDLVNECCLVPLVLSAMFYSTLLVPLLKFYV